MDNFLLLLETTKNEDNEDEASGNLSDEEALDEAGDDQENSDVMATDDYRLIKTAVTSPSAASKPEPSVSHSNADESESEYDAKLVPGSPTAGVDKSSDNFHQHFDDSLCDHCSDELTHATHSSLHWRRGEFTLDPLGTCALLRLEHPLAHESAPSASHKLIFGIDAEKILQHNQQATDYCRQQVLRITCHFPKPKLFIVSSTYRFFLLSGHLYFLQTWKISPIRIFL